MTPNRPCACDRFLPGQTYVAERDCPKCWMFAHRPAVRKAWSGDPADCTPLAAAPQGASAAGRPTYEPAGREAEAGTIRHLLYFVYPAATGGGRVWRWNLDKLRRRMNLFNGRRVVAVATGPGAEPASAVRKALAGCGVDFLEVHNDPALREMAAFPALLESVSAYDGHGHVTFYGHAKGVTSESWSPAVRRWTEAMYAGCLDHWPAVRRALVDRPFVGAFKRHGAVWAESGSQWHYSGTFRWHRNADFYSRDWRGIDPHWWGSESHPSLHFHPDEAACLFGEFSGNGLGLYLPATWDDWAAAAAERWREDHLSDRWHPLLLTCVLTSHHKPRFVHEAVQSVRAQTAGDWQLIVMDSGALAGASTFDGYRDDPRIRVATTGETPDMRGRVCLQSWAINECFRRGLVRGDLVCYLSDDDVFDPGIFGAWFSAARSHPEQTAWYGSADRCEVRDGVEVKVGDLPTVGLGGRGGVSLKCKVDGMQICHRRAATVPWPEDPLAAEYADGAFMDALGKNVAIHPIEAKVGSHRHTTDSTFTRPAGCQVPSDWNDIPGWCDFAPFYSDVARELSDGSVFVEVGVWMGKSLIHAALQLRRLGKKVRLFAVDTFTGSTGDGAMQALAQQFGGSVRKRFEKNLIDFGVSDSVTILELPSVAAAAAVADASVDFVFIDADHDYEAVKADITAWLPKMKPGGVMAGHDRELPGVMRAVREAFKAEFIRTDGPCWVVRTGGQH